MPHPILGVTDAPKRVRPGRASFGAFTLAEVLAALAFMAIVIPVAVEGIRIAARAEQVGIHKAVAARVADRVLNEWLAAGRSVAAQPRGMVEEGFREYRWNLRTELWPEDSMRLLTVEVLYEVQGREHEVRVSTLTDLSSP